MRAILHSDLNSYYASVEMMLDPTLRGKAVAVCGSTETRHGIVLAKSELAKKAGVKTGMVNWEAPAMLPWSRYGSTPIRPVHQVLQPCTQHIWPVHRPCRALWNGRMLDGCYRQLRHWLPARYCRANPASDQGGTWFDREHRRKLYEDIRQAW